MLGLRDTITIFADLARLIEFFEKIKLSLAGVLWFRYAFTLPVSVNRLVSLGPATRIRPLG
jgi:hypothetical protein